MPTAKKIIAGLLSAFLLVGLGYGVFSFRKSYWPFMNESNAQEDVRVEGNFTAKNSEPVSNITFDSLLQYHPDAPRKKEKSGEFYAWAKSAIAIDVDTNTILYYQDGRKKMAIASLTKMMTAIVVLENIKDIDDEIVTIDADAVSADGTVVGCPRTGYCISNRLRVGEKMTAKNLLEAMIMNSTNDAAIALGNHIAGSQKQFAKMMNEKARELGLRETNFCNPSGLDEESRPGECYSTAYDLARISAYSFKHDEIWEIMKIKEKDIYSVNGGLAHHIVNTDVLIDQVPYYLGGKTGFTYEAGKSLMMAAHDPNNRKRRVVAVLLDDNQRWEDMQNLFSWVFAAYSWPENRTVKK